MLFVKGDQCPHSHQAKMYEQEVPLDLFCRQKRQFQMVQPYHLKLSFLLTEQTQWQTGIDLGGSAEQSQSQEGRAQQWRQGRQWKRQGRRQRE